MADDTLEPRSTVATLHRPEIDAQVDPQPYKDAGMMHTVPMPATGAPIKWAPAQPMQDKVNADVVAIFTDEETWAGPMHVVQALAQYRTHINPKAKLVADNFAATGSSVVEGREDGGVLRVVGFDTNVPNLIADFARE